MLTKDEIAELRKPFRADQVKFKIQTQPKGTGNDGWGVVVSYLDARDVAERLDVVIGGDWQDTYELFGKALECSLTVNGVTRKDVGEAASAKELYSDAFKRAAVKFGVGAFLYRMPTIMAKLTRKDERKPWGLTDGAKSSLKGIADAVAAGKAPAARYPDLMLLSEYQAPEAVGDDTPPAPVEQPQSAPQQQSRPNTPPAPAQATLTPGQAQTLHKRLGAMLGDTEYREMTHNAYAAQVIGREVKSLTDLTPAEAKQVQDAANAVPKAA